MYVGFEDNGAFYHIRNVTKETTRLGPKNAKPIAGTRYSLRLLDDSSGQMADNYVYLSDWDKIVGVDQGPVNYDPRERPWYKIAVENKHISVSDVYIFSGSGKPGITVSQAAVNDNGSIIATVGVDISLDDLTRYLDRKKIGSRGRTVILDEKGQVIVQSGAGEKTNEGSGALSDRDVEQAINHHKTHGETSFTIDGANTVMATFLPFPNNFENDWVIGVIADRDEFVADINQATFRTLVVGLLIVLGSIIVATFLSKRLTSPLRQIVEETRRIREFDLAGTFALRSNIIEINDLALAIKAMRHSLRSFGAYVPKTLVRSIVSSGSSVEIGGQHQQITLLFSDIQSFTNKSENMAPSTIFEELSNYFSVMTDAIGKHHGTVDKFIGDAIMAFWNAPVEDNDHPANGCRAALACLAAGRLLNETALRDGYSGMLPVTTRFGLHTGEVMVGNVGSDDRMQYTALGASVNLASRIEGINKQYGTNLLITAAVAKQVTGQFLLRPVDVIQPVGTSLPIAIFELFGELDADASFTATDQQRSFCSLWQACFLRYEQRDWNQAALMFKDFARTYPDDKLAALYIERCNAFIAKPPPADWDGVQVYDTK